MKVCVIYHHYKHSKMYAKYMFCELWSNDENIYKLYKSYKLYKLILRYRYKVGTYIFIQYLPMWNIYVIKMLNFLNANSFVLELDTCV